MSKIKWSEPIETITGVPITVVDGPDSSGNRKIRSGNDFLDDYMDWTDADGRILGIKKLGPLIRNVAAPAEPVKLSDGSVIRGEWWIRQKAGTAIIYRLANITSFYIDCDDATIYFTDSDSERVKFADARLIAAAIKLDLDAMIGGKDV